ncbi:hypothetical protein AB5N19_01553 [Seiridium cardinale]
MATTSTTANASNPLLDYLALLPDQSFKAMIWECEAMQALAMINWKGVNKKLTIEKIRRRLAEHRESKDPIICTSLPPGAPPKSITERFEFTSENWFPNESRTIIFDWPFLGHKNTINEFDFLENDLWVAVIHGSVRIEMFKRRRTMEQTPHLLLRKGEQEILPKGFEYSVRLCEDSIILLGHFGPEQTDSGLTTAEPSGSV